LKIIALASDRFCWGALPGYFFLMFFKFFFSAKRGENFEILLRAKRAKKNQTTIGRSPPEKSAVLFVLQKVIEPKSGDHRPKNAQYKQY
jgi:hypothetical protein